MPEMSAAERRVRERYRDDYEWYAEDALKIRTKSGKVLPFRLNSSQRKVHLLAEKQLAEIGMVRMLILKSRQIGFSTYIEGRFYWKTTHRRGVRSFILTHRDDATNNLFTMAKRFHDNVPPFLRPQTKATNAKELDFGRLDSGYRVATATASGVGRSDTIQLFHGSEVAFWRGTADSAAGVFDAIPDEPGTEIWLETTGNGTQGIFPSMWRAALRGETSFIPVFIPWFDHDEYRLPVHPDAKFPDEFEKYAETYGIDREQLAWMWQENAEKSSITGDDPEKICWLFYREYPATPDDAFIVAGDSAYIQPQIVVKARNTKMAPQNHRPLVLGCDFARGTRDRNSFISRRGRIAGDEVNESFHSQHVPTIANRLARILDRLPVAMAFLDAANIGAAVYDILCDLGYEDRLTLVNFGGEPNDKERYANKRAEMYGEARGWLSDAGGAELPQDDLDLQSELCSVGYRFNSRDQLLMEEKEKVRERLGFSPDRSDSFILTFAEPVSLNPNQPTEAPRADDGYDPHKW